MSAVHLEALREAARAANAGAVAEIAQMRAAGVPWRDVAAALNAAGLTTRYGCTWTEDSVWVIWKRWGTDTTSGEV